MKKLLLAFVLPLVLSSQAFALTAESRRSFVVKSYSPNPASSTAYTAGDAIAGYSTLTGVPQNDNGVATLWGLAVTDNEAKLPDTDIFFFKAAPTETAADNAAFTVSSASLRNDFVGVIRVANANCVGAGAGQSVCEVKDVNLPLQGSTASKLYVLAVARSTQSSGYSASTSIKVKFFFNQE